MKQQFFVGDKVREKDTDLPMGWSNGMDSCCGQVGTVDAKREYQDGTVGYYVVFASNISWYFAPEWLTIVERAWQKNTGEQPVDGNIEVEISLGTYGTDKAPADQYRWDFEDSSGDIVEWRIADSISNEEQSEAIPPTHDALGDNLVFLGSGKLAAVDAKPIEQEWTDKHYDNNYTLTQKDIERGFVKIDPYFVSKMWKIGSKDDSGALWHCFKTIARFGEKNSREREVKALYAQIKRLAEIEGVDLNG